MPRNPAGRGRVDEHPELAFPGGIVATLHHFDTNSSELGPAHREWLQTNVIPILVEGGSVDGVIGDASPLGSSDANRALSLRRAEAVVQFLHEALRSRDRSEPFHIATPQGDGESRGHADGLAGRSDAAYYRAVRISVSPAHQEEDGATDEQGFGIGGGNVGQGDYLVRDGDCISSIARAHGHHWENIWNHHGNQELNEVRKNPNILFAGDRVTIPPRIRKEEPRVTESRHRFRLRGESVFVHLRFLKDDQPRSNEPFRLIIDDHTETGFLDADGLLSRRIPALATSARVEVGEGREITAHELKLGRMAPITELSGIQRRLHNLGFNCDDEATLGDRTRAAIEAFQRAHEKEHGLEVTGQPDAQTQRTLARMHGS